MNKYPPYILSPTYSTPLLRSHPSQPYYYPYNNYSSSVTPVSRISSSRNPYSSILSYYNDDEEPYVQEYYHRSHTHSHHSHVSYPHYRHSTSSYSKPSRAQSVISSQTQSVTTSVRDDSSRYSSNQQNLSDYDAKTSMSESEQGVLRRDNKRSNPNLYKPLNVTDLFAKSQADIRQEFRKLPNPPAKDTHAAKDPRNLDKSRYRDVIPGEATRVKLCPDEEDKHDFINANYVSGHNNQEKAYIFTQGPLQSTVKDFWRMVWQENIYVIVMTTNIRESGTMKCFPYWPLETKETLNTGLYQIQNERSDKYESFVITTLTLRKRSQPDDIRVIYHAHYIKWPDHGVPAGTKDALLFLKTVDSYRQSTDPKASVLLHCSAGIGRTGTFCAIDIGIKRYDEKRTIDIPSTVLKMRQERAGSVQTEDQYVFAYLAMMEYIKQQQAVEQQMQESVALSEKASNIVSDEGKLRDSRIPLETDDQRNVNLRGRMNGKKLTDAEQTNTPPTMHSSKTIYLTESVSSDRGKTLSDSSASAVHYLTPAVSTTQAEPNRQRAITDQVSSTSTNNTSVRPKKVRK